jgi:hypothetical protein
MLDWLQHQERAHNAVGRVAAELLKDATVLVGSRRQPLGEPTPARCAGPKGLEKKTFTKDKAAPDAQWRYLFFAGVEPPDALTDSGDAVIDPVKPAVRIDAANPRHHLWNNHGTWWCHLTVHLPDHTK